jgi:hypothetical protein
VSEYFELFGAVANQGATLTQVGLTPEEYCSITPFDQMRYSDIEERIQEMQAQLRARQQVGIVAGRCLRLFVHNLPPVALSRMACQMTHMLDLHYFAAFTRHGIASLCLRAQWTMACFNQRKSAEESLSNELQPAEKLFEEKIGIKNLFNRPFRIAEPTRCPIL